MPVSDRMLEILRGMSEALERGDEGDMDSPAWENEALIARLRTQLRQMAPVPVVGAERPTAITVDSRAEVIANPGS